MRDVVVLAIGCDVVECSREEWVTLFRDCSTGGLL